MREESKKFKEPLPARIKNKPLLFFGLALYLNAWFDLDLERDRSKLEKITRRSCFAYAEDYGLDEEQAEDLQFYIGRMDNDFLPWFGKRNKKKEPRGRGRDAQRTGKGATGEG